MTNEKRFLGYLDSLKCSTNQKLIECVQNGFKTLVEYQVVGNMSERGVDLMEGNEPSAIPDSIRSLVEKLTAEIEELRDAMVDINEITEPLVPEEVAEEVAEEEAEEESTDAPTEADLKKMKKAELVDVAKSMGLSHTGTKSDLIERITQA